MRPSNRRARRAAKGPSRPAASALAPAEVTRLLDEAGRHFDAGRLEAAARAYEVVEARNPDDLRAPYSLATIDIRQGRLKPALERLRTVVAIEPRLTPALHNLGYAAQSLGLWNEAADAYAQAWAFEPNAIETGFSLAVAQAVLGRTEAALDTYRRLAADPASRLRAVTRLAILKAQAITDEELEVLRAAARDPSVTGEARVGAMFALGEALDARRRDDEAFAAFATGNRLKFEALARGPVHPDTVARAHARASAFVRELFSPEFFARNRLAASSGPSPIFIVGMPRSGSTLVEQILAAHRDVQAFGETGVLPVLLEGAYADAGGAALSRAEFRRLAGDFLKEMRGLGWKTGSRLVDKTLENYLHVGAIHLMFPHSVILHSVRDPVDTCLACYRQLFASGAETLYDLRQIAAEYIGYRRIMEHWESVLPGRVVEVSLEALVADPKRRIRWLVTEACGLGWDPNCLAFYEIDRPVLSASLAQVRQPIYSSAVQRWRRHERHLAPLLEALGPYATGLA